MEQYEDNEIQIGSLILAKLQKEERSISWLARQIYCDESNLGRMLRKNTHLHADFLLRISCALGEDFFAHYSAAYNAHCHSVNFTEKLPKISRNSL